MLTATTVLSMQEALMVSGRLVTSGGLSMTIVVLALPEDWQLSVTSTAKVVGSPS